MLAQFLRNRDGGVAILAPGLMLAVLGASAFTVDLGYQIYSGVTLQNAADAGALAAVRRLNDRPAATREAIDIAARNVPASFGSVTKASDVVFGHFDATSRTFTSGASPTNAVRVTSARDAGHGNEVPRFLAGVLGAGKGSVQRSAVAQATSGRSACVIALDPTTPQSFHSSGSGIVDVPNCGIYVNSTAPDAMHNQGPGGIYAKSIDIVGGFSGVNLNPVPSTGQPPIADPMAGRPEPVAPTKCDYNNAKFSKAQTIPAGSTMCGTVDIDSDVVFSSGIHYFVNATVRLTSRARVTGSGVTFYLNRDSYWDSTGSGFVKLTAPASGPTAGVVLWGSRLEPTVVKKTELASSFTTMRVRGGKDYLMGGTIYVPKQRMEFRGSADLEASAPNGYVIAHQFSFSGNSGFTFDGHGLPNGFNPNVANTAMLVQ
jgi:Flp pilus assembly protein TadG